MKNHIAQMKKAAEELLEHIDLETDCMSNQIKRQHIDIQFDALELAIKEANEQPEAGMKFSVQELRPEVFTFALLMEQRLREKDAEKGESWKSRRADAMFSCAAAKLFVIDKNLVGYSPTSHRDLEPAALKHVVDLANFSMMMADVSGLLVPENGGAGWAGLDQVQMP